MAGKKSVRGLCYLFQIMNMISNYEYLPGTTSIPPHGRQKIVAWAMLFIPRRDICFVLPCILSESVPGLCKALRIFALHVISLVTGTKSVRGLFIPRRDLSFVPPSILSESVARLCKAH